MTINAALIEAAFDNDALESGTDYGDVFARIPQVRILATRSDLDLALKDAYPAAGVFNLRTGSKPAFGFAGPTAATPGADAAAQLSIDLGFSLASVPALDDRLVIADLTPLHRSDGYEVTDPLSGHHSDIFHEEIYQLIGGFMFPG